MTDLRRYMSEHRRPVLCVGPMSRNCVTAVVRYADALERPIPLIASRRQVEAASLGGGYVENWTTESFAAFVRSLGAAHAPLCRDHGGPWQGANEDGLDAATAMERAKASIAEDLEQGFSIIHLDPSIGEHERAQEETLEMLFDLYEFTVATARALGRRVELEIGAEQQSGDVAGPEQLIGFLKAVTRFCREGRHQHPLFCVVQTGTLVREMRNIGLTEGRRNEEFDQRYAVATMEKHVRALADVAYINGVHVKEHNGDYLSDGSMAARADWEIGGVNVAPEFGVLETKTLLSVATELGMPREREALTQLFFESGKWRKWMRRGSTATDLHKAVIAGHYCFAAPEFLDVKGAIAKRAASRGIDLDGVIQQSLTALLRRMTWCLGYHEAAPAAQGARSTSKTLTERAGVEHAA